MIVELISFGFKYNSIPEANYLIDVRFLPNPFYVDELRSLTGLDKEVISFFEKDNSTSTQQFILRLLDWLNYIIEVNKNANKEKIIIAIGCTGGQHRSPYILELISKNLKKNSQISKLAICHKQLNKSEVQ